jgi:inner membrane protein
MAIGERRFGLLLTKSVLVGLLTLGMLWPLSKVQSLIDDRQQLQQQAYARVANAWGGQQIIGGPILSVPTQEMTIVLNRATDEREQLWKAASPIRLLSEKLRIESTVRVEMRSKGIYSTPVYVSQVVISGEFTAAAVHSTLIVPAAQRVLPSQAQLDLPLTGLKSLRAVERFEFAGRSLRPQSGQIAELAALTVPLDLSALEAGVALPFRIELEVAGSDSLRFLPLGAATTVTAVANWPHPDFNGEFLPVSRDITAAGFKAQWKVLQLNRGIPQQWRGDAVSATTLCATAFGFALFQPADLYTRNYRAVRYGILFVAITFLCFFAWEHVSRELRLHPMQYLLVGLALATFYLLLVALSEHVGFALAYAVAAAALVLLITIYIASATGRRTAAVAIGAGLSIAYGLLFLILLSEDYALLLGALLVFGVLAGLMLATRRLDWGAVGRPGSG